MKKKIIICSMVFVMVMLIASTAFAMDLNEHHWNGSCSHFFTTSEYVNNYRLSDGEPIYAGQNVCYDTVGSNNYSTNDEIYVVNTSGNTVSEKIYPFGYADGHDFHPTASGDLHMRIYNYYHYNEGYSIHSEGYFYQELE